MTYADLKRSILTRGFETLGEYAEDPSIMVDSLNLAMREITNVFPLVDSYRITQGFITPTVSFGGSRQYDGVSALVYEASAVRSFYLQCSGTGVLRVHDADGVRELALSSAKQLVAYRGFLRGDARLECVGSFSYEVRNVAFYGEISSDKEEDIPAFGDVIRYDFRELTKKDGQALFLGFLDKVEEGDFHGGVRYRGISDFWIEKPSTLLLPGKQVADYKIFYRRDFVPFTLATPESYLIELDADKTHLLELLAAWYVWKDDETVRASECRNDYEDFKNTLLLLESKQNRTQDFINGLGW